MTLYVNKNMQPDTLALNHIITPKKGRGDNKKWVLQENLNPSVADPLFQKEREAKVQKILDNKEADLLPNVDREILVRKTEKAITATVLEVKVSKEEKATKIDRVGRIALNRENLRDHIEQRISAFLMQIIDCYDTDKYFTVGTTQDQAESAKEIRFKLEKTVKADRGSSLKMDRAAAHHGTIPCLFAYPRDAWNTWKAHNDIDRAGKPEASIYFSKSQTYYLNNACSGLEKVINQADIDVDGNPTEKSVEFGKKKRAEDLKLREFTIKLLNQAACKEIDPIQGLGLFMDKLQAVIHQELKNATEADKKAIFKAWKEDVDELVGDYQDNYCYFIALQLGIHIPVKDRDSINLQEVIFPRHFRILQTKNLYQSQLLVRIDTLKAKILKRAAKKPREFDKAFKLALMEKAFEQTSATKKVFQRLFNCSGQSLKALQKECEQTCKPALRLVGEMKAQKEINDFFEELPKFVRNFSIDETVFSSALMRQIRETRRLSLRKFSAAYNAAYPKERRPLNYEQLRRIENGCVKPKPRMVKQFAHVLNIHESVLLPELSF